MKTSELIAALSTGAGPAPRAVVARRLTPAGVIGMAVAAAAALVAMGPAPAEMITTAALWTKLAYAGLLIGAAGWLTACLARPAFPTARPWRLLVAISAAMAVLGVTSLLLTPSGERISYLMGHSALQCPWNVLALAVPALGATLWAVRGLAPTRPRLAGFAAGLFSGAIGAFAYALACPEVSITFIAVWYSVGIALSGALGALLGPWALHW